MLDSAATAGHHPFPGWPLDLLVFYLSFTVFTYLHLCLHELGHLVTALAMRLRVVEVVVLRKRAVRRRVLGVRFGMGIGSRGSVSHVAALAMPGSRFVAPRFLLVTLAGPAANIASGSVIGTVYLRGHQARFPSHALLVFAVLGIAAGLGNLVPYRRRSGRRTDGAQILRLLFRPGTVRKEWQVKLSVAEVETARKSNDLGRLREALESTDPAVVAAAAKALCSTPPDSDGPVREDLVLLTRVLTAGTVPLDTAAPVAAQVVLRWGSQLMLLQYRNRIEHQDAEWNEWLGDLRVLAEHFRRRCPDHALIRVALAFVRLLEGRHEETRSLLLFLDEIPGAAKGFAIGIRAMAEAMLGDLVQAKRLIRAGKDVEGLAGGMVKIAAGVVRALEEQAASGSSSPT